MLKENELGLNSEIERVDAEKINLFELMREKEEVHAQTIKELERKIEAQRKEVDDLEVSNASLRDQIHNEENLSLPALWLKRQEETRDAFGRSSEEIEMLRDRLRDQEKKSLGRGEAAVCRNFIITGCTKRT